MKTLQNLALILALTAMATQPAFAASTTTVYNSGILVLLFVGFCALVVVVQLIPALITLWGMLVGVLTNKSRTDAAEVHVRK